MNTSPYRIDEVIDTGRFPLDRQQDPGFSVLVARGRHDLAARGTFNLEGFVRPRALERALGELAPAFAADAFHHEQTHNVYFTPDDPSVSGTRSTGLRQRSSNHTLCCDQLPGSLIRRIYEWDPLRAFLAEVLGRPALRRMADPLARLNVMCYRAGDTLGWHFDRAAFSVTLLLQAAEHGGTFEYRKDLRSDDDPNHGGVADVVRGLDPHRRTLVLTPGTLNVFRGRRSIHRVTPVQGGRARYVAVLSFVEGEGGVFSDADRVQFYGRSKARAPA